jgi:hypothetical protein
MMIFAYCRCGWTAFVTDLTALNGMHLCQPGNILLYRQFNQKHIAPDGVTVLLGQARAAKEFERLTA